ncbi:hypothetical protein SLA2020_279470 [Shorea laevis]
MVNFLKSSNGNGRNFSKSAKASTVEESKFQDPLPSKRRSYAEVMKKNCKKEFKMPVSLKAQPKMPENPFVLLRRPASELPKMPERTPVQFLAKHDPKPRPAPKPKAPVPFPPKIQGSRTPASLSVLGNGADKVDSLPLGRDGSDTPFEDFGHPFGENSERASFRNTLNRLKRDVEKCLKWVDSGLCPCVCGLLGPAPKPTLEAHVRQPLPAGPVRGGSLKEKKKGFLGRKPKVMFKPVSNKCPLLSGPGPFVSGIKRGPGPSDKGKKALFNPVVSIWVPGQASSSMTDPSPKQATGSGSLAVTATSPSEGIPAAALHSQAVPPPPIVEQSLRAASSSISDDPLPELDTHVGTEHADESVAGVPAAGSTAGEPIVEQSLRADSSTIPDDLSSALLSASPTPGVGHACGHRAFR